ncbi:MAG: homoserine O-acetyltransferase [Leptonema illini]|uniref:Homoserine O-acetyltransferase n=1 Tax=Leptonema illini TaxID=183 RepID=A0A833H4L7_9LEPT|nr:MAG: homoserine O-acetyltransferase [Leptonema illini]
MQGSSGNNTKKGFGRGPVGRRSKKMSEPQESMATDLQDGAAEGYRSDVGEIRTQTARLPGMTTRSGYNFPYIDINYMTLGELSPAKDNAILITHALSGNAHVAGINETGKPGWWDHYVGPGKPIDTDRFFVICSNVLGGCNGSTGPTSINPDTEKPYNMQFPPVTIQDMVKAQSLLIDSLGIERLFAVVGGSMGGMQALSWAVDFPERLHLCVPIAAAMTHSAIQIAFNEVGRQAILTDPNWKRGEYDADTRPEHGLAVARMIGHVTYLSEAVMENKFGRRHQRPPRPEDVFPVFFAIESYLQYQGLSFVNRFDPNTYLYITKALDMYDLLDGRNADEALAGVKCRFLIVSFESDWLYPPKQSREMARILRRAGKAVTYLNLDTEYGHDSFLIQNPPLQKVLDSFLDLEYKNLQTRASGAGR